MKQILLMIAVVTLVGCGKNEPVQPSASNTEATKAKAGLALVSPLVAPAPFSSTQVIAHDNAS